MKTSLLFFGTVLVAAILVYTSSVLLAPSRVDLPPPTRPSEEAGSAKTQSAPQIHPAAENGGKPESTAEVTVAGRVVVAADGGPAVHARVLLYGPAENAGTPGTTSNEAGPVQVTVYSAGGPTSRAPRDLAGAWTDHDGRFALFTTNSGPYRVRAHAPGYADALATGVARGSLHLVLRLRPAGTVTGRVVDGEGAPVPSAHVLVAEGQPVESRKDGTFELPGVPAGSPAELTASAPGFKNARASIEVRSGQIVALPKDLVLSPKPGIRGRALSPDGTPLAKVAVSVEKNGTTYTGDGLPAVSDDTGRWFLPEAESHGFTTLPSGSLTLTFRHRDYREKTIDVQHGAGQVTDVGDVHLQPGAVIAGRITGPDGRPVKGALAVALSHGIGATDLLDTTFSGSPSPGTRRSDANGNYRVAGLETGTYKLLVLARGFLPFEKEDVTLHIPDASTVDVVLSRGKTVSGTVLDPGGKPVAKATVRVFRESKPTTFEEAFLAYATFGAFTSDADGRFSASGLSNDAVTVRAEKKPWGPALRKHVAPGTSGLVLHLVRTGNVSGTVVAAEDGKPLADVLVTLHREQKEASTVSWTPPPIDTTTGSDGTYRLDGASPGKYTVDCSGDNVAPGKSAVIRVVAGKTTTGVRIELVRGSSIPVVVRRSVDGSPVEHASIRMALSGRSTHRTTTWSTDPEGRAQIGGLTPGTYDLGVTAKGLAPFVRTGITVPVPGGIHVVMTEGGRVRGVVYDEKGRPAPHRYVSVQDPSSLVSSESAKTGADGTFVLDHVAPGRRTIAVVAMTGTGDFGVRSKTVEVPDGGEVALQFGKPGGRRTAHLEARLLDGGEPLAGRMIALIPLSEDSEGGSGFRTTSTDKEGRFDLPNLRPGKYRVAVLGPGGNMQGGTDLLVDQTGNVTRDVSLPQGRLSGVVVRGDTGAPVAGAQVMLVDPVRLAAPIRSLSDVFSLAFAQTSTGADGTFTLQNAVTGQHALLVSADGMAPSIVDGVTVSESGGEPLRVSVLPGVKLTVVVKDPDGAPVTGARAAVFDAEGRWLPKKNATATMTDQEGRISFRLLPGAYRVRIDGAKFAVTDASVDLRGDLELPVSVTAGGDVSVRVTGQAGPVKGAEIRLFPQHGQEIYRLLRQETALSGGSTILTGSDGTVDLPHLPAGTLRITARTPDGKKGTATITVIEGGRTQVSIAVR